jgi:molecular chaperone DnaJ
MFGGGGGRRGPAAGDDLQVRVKLSLEEVATGVEKKIRVKHQRPCPTCEGRGGQGETTCTQCGGRGQVRHVQQSIFGQFVNIATCPRCHGEGRSVKEPCKTCDGDGRVSETETLSVKVPPGVAEGNFIPIRGMGDAGLRKAPAGDLIVLIEEKPHTVFDRDGNDLHVDVPVSFPVMALGGKVEVPTLEGEPASISIKAGTPSGHVSRVRGRGLPSLRGARGDLIARLVVWIPERLGGREKKALEELQQAESFRPPKPGKSLFDRVRDAFAG